MIRRPRFEDEESAQAINISPLIDVIFILLIFFIVTMVFADGSAMNLDVPEAANADVVKNNSATVAIRADSSVWLDGRKYALSGLASELRRRAVETVILRADEKVSVSSLVSVMDCAKSSGAKDIFVAAKKKN